MSPDDIAKKYCKPSTAAALARVPVQAIYLGLQTGTCRGLCVDGTWLVERASLKDFTEARQRKAAAAQRRVPAA